LNKSNFKEYWNERFDTGKYIWGKSPSRTAEYALDLFTKMNVKSILIPGSGYGRNTKLFSSNGFEVDGVEVSDTGFSMAQKYDPGSTFYNEDLLNIQTEDHLYDAVYAFNILHLFRERERMKIVKRWAEQLKDKGVVFVVVFSEQEDSYGRGKEVEKNTFESKPGRPVHYFTEEDLNKHFKKFNIIESGVVKDPENHGNRGQHIHKLRYVFAEKTQ